MSRPVRLEAFVRGAATAGLFALLAGPSTAWAAPPSGLPPLSAQIPVEAEEPPSDGEETVLAPLAPVDTSTPAALPPFDLEAFRRELREELRQELREELREELLGEIEDARGAPLEPATAPIEDDAFAEEGWKWLEPERPELELIELDGYFRFRYDFFHDLDLATYSRRRLPDGQISEEGPFVPGFSPPVSLCDTDVRELDGEGNPVDCRGVAGESNSLGGANIRFRLEPTLNVFEDVKIKSQIDILDNLVLGSTPDSLYSPLSPVAALSDTQITPSAGVSTVLRDSIRVKRVWAEVMTPLGQLSFGRMPNHVGMGISANDGRGLDMDFGDTVDRIMFSAKIGDFLIAPAFDYAATGATSANLFQPQGQPFDRDQRDDVDQYVLTVSKTDSPEVEARKLANDEVVFNFGTQQMLRIQALDSRVVDAVEVSGTDPDDPGSAMEPNQRTATFRTVNGQATARDTLERDAQIYLYSYWATFKYRKLSISAEYSGRIGRIGNLSPPGPYGTQSGSARINQHGGALRGSYKFLDDKLEVEMLVLAASGDSAPGWGVFPFGASPNVGASQTQAGAWEGNQAPGGDDTSITNFRFDPDFIVDLIFWRQLVGLVTDAVVVRPSVQYNLTPQLGGRLDIIYSRAMFGGSTPSGSFSDGSPATVGSPDNNLGVEADLTLFYQSEEGFNARLQYGLFIPMDGLDRLVRVEQGGQGEQAATIGADGAPALRLNAEIAQTIQVFFGVAF